MKRRTIAYVMDADTPDDQIHDAAEAATEDETHLNCLVLAPAPALPIYAYGVPPYGGMNIPDHWPDLVTEAQKIQQERVDAIEALLAKSNASGSVISALSATQDIKHHVARVARVSDEAFLAASLRAHPDTLREAAAGVLFHSPIGFRINGALSAAPQRIFVSWDSSEAAACAVHAALPRLKASNEVLIACIDPVTGPERDGQDPGTDIAAWLSHHGCRVTVSQFPSAGREIGACLEDRAREFGADLVVMGAYGQARMIQTVLGGTTRTMLEQTELPVLFAH